MTSRARDSILVEVDRLKESRIQSMEGRSSRDSIDDSYSINVLELTVLDVKFTIDLTSIWEDSLNVSAFRCSTVEYNVIEG
jgi:hypothetical protein